MARGERWGVRTPHAKPSCIGLAVAIPAQQQYGDRPLEVTGTVTGITLDFSHDPVIQLAGLNQFQNVEAALAEASKAKAGSVSKGQSVTLACASVSEIVGTPMLKECELP